MSLEKNMQLANQLTASKIRLVVQPCLMIKRSQPLIRKEIHPTLNIPYDVEEWYDLKKLQAFHVSFEGKQVRERDLRQGVVQLMELAEQEMRQKGLVDNG